MNDAEKIRKITTKFQKSKEKQELDLQRKFNRLVLSKEIQSTIALHHKRIVAKAKHEAARGLTELTYNLEDNRFDYRFGDALMKSLSNEGFRCSIQKFPIRDEFENLVTEHRIVVAWV